MGVCFLCVLCVCGCAPVLFAAAFYCLFVCLHGLADAVGCGTAVTVNARPALHHTPWGMSVTSAGVPHIPPPPSPFGVVSNLVTQSIIATLVRPSSGPPSLTHPHRPTDLPATVAINPNGRNYASGAEDGYVRLHFFDKSYLDMKDPVPEADEEEQGDDEADGAAAVAAAVSAQ